MYVQEYVCPKYKNSAKNDTKIHSKEKEKRNRKDNVYVEQNYVSVSE